ncbi:MAG: phage holin family protein [Bacteroidota bacterium]|nr:phage holin family protein [Bacteroidota bacterium]
MSEKKLSENLAELKNLAKSYVDSYIILLKLRFLEKLSRIGTFLVSAVILIMILGFALFFATFAFSYWYGKNMGNFAEGLLISTAFYLLLAIIVYVFRKKLIGNPVIKTISSILFKEDDENEEE